MCAVKFVLWHVRVINIDRCMAPCVAKKEVLIYFGASILGWLGIVQRS
jgi:hypothetical protein